MTARHSLVGSNLFLSPSVVESSSAWGEMGSSATAGCIAAFLHVFVLTDAVDRKRGERKIEGVVAGTPYRMWLER